MEVMNEAKTVEKWSDTQIKYAAFLSRDKTTIGGVKKSNADFAKAIGVGEATLYRWKMLPGFMLMVFEMNMRHELVDDLPKMTKSVKAAILGQELSYKDAKGKLHKLKPANIPAYLAIMRQANLLQSDKIESRNENYDQVTYKFAE